MRRNLKQNKTISQLFFSKFEKSVILFQISKDNINFYKIQYKFQYLVSYALNKILLIENYLCRFDSLLYNILFKTKFIFMGNKANKDPNVDLYLDVDKPFYWVGQQIKGNVYLNAKTYIKYTALYVRFQSNQYCHWQQARGDTQEHFYGQRQIYKDEYLISRFDQGLQVGNYSFPFSFRIDPDLPGTYFDPQDSNFSIKFPIKAHLTDFTKKLQPQQYEFPITIIEKFRLPIVSEILTRTGSPKVFCCIPQGQTSLTIEFPSNVSVSSDELPVKLNVNNKNFKQNLKTVEFKVVKHLYATSNLNEFRNWSRDISIQNTKEIPAGEEMNVDFFVQMPKNISTTFGQLTGTYYTIEARSKAGGCICCCNDQPIIQKHIFVNAKTPNIEPKQVLQPPAGWNPIKANTLIFPSSEKYQHIQNPHMGLMNRGTMILTQK